MRETFETRRELSHRGTLRVFARAIRYVAPFRGAFAVKTLLTVVSLFPPLLLPWPIKMQIDSYLEGIPVDPSHYPFFLAFLVEPLVGAPPEVILYATLIVLLNLLVDILYRVIDPRIRER